MIIQCSKCKEQKEQTNFYKTKQSKSGYRSWCKICHYTGSNNSPNRKYNANTYYAKTKAKNPALFMWKQAKHRAKFDYNNMEFSIVVEDIIIPDKCPYFNVPFIPLDKEWCFSLDRIDSFKGYNKNNIQVISYKANKMKNDASLQELLTFAEGVLAHHSKKT